VRRNFIFALRDDVVSEPIGTLPLHPDPVPAFRTKTYSRIADGAAPVWLPDSRRLVYASAGRLFLVDTASKQPREILARQGEVLDAPSLTPRPARW
jgi:hypothetical protein